VRVDALGFVVLCKVEGAKLSFVVEHVEVVIFEVVVDECGHDLLLVVRIRAEIGIGAIPGAMREVRAELFLVFLVVVVLLHEGMRVEAGIPLGALLVLFDEGAHLSVEVAVAVAVLGVVVVHAVFVVVRLGDVAGGHFEDIQVEVLRGGDVTFTMGAVWNW
jgi:hypothetical protein